MSDEKITDAKVTAALLEYASNNLVFMQRPNLDLVAICGGQYEARCLALEYHAWNQGVPVQNLPGMYEDELLSIPLYMLFCYLAEKFKATAHQEDA